MDRTPFNHVNIDDDYYDDYDDDDDYDDSSNDNDIINL